jgi:hypothetical protein
VPSLGAAFVLPRGGGEKRAVAALAAHELFALFLLGLLVLAGDRSSARLPRP